MLLYNYFLEIKNRIFLIFICWIAVFITCYFYKDILLFLLVKLSVKGNKVILFYFIATNITDVFNVYLNIAYFISHQATIFIFFYQCLSFVASGLFVYEYEKIKFCMTVSLTFAVWSIYVLNVYVLPYIWDFFLSFNTDSFYSVDIFFEAKITEYFNFYKKTYFISIIFSQIFGVIFFVIEFVNDKLKFVLKTRKLFYGFFLITATLLTPSDVFSQLSFVFWLFCFFEIILVFIFLKLYISKMK